MCSLRTGLQNVVAYADLPADPRLGHGPAQLITNDTAHGDTDFLVRIERFLRGGRRLRLFQRGHGVHRDYGGRRQRLFLAPRSRNRDQDRRAGECTKATFSLVKIIARRTSSAKAAAAPEPFA